MIISEDTKLLRSIENLSVHDHLCLIYENQKEQFDAVIPFIRIGLSKGEKCIYIADDNTADQVLCAMRADGIDVDSALSKGALVIANKNETYLKQGYFDPDEMIQFLKVTTDSTIKEGFSALRVTGDMTWVLGKEPGSMRLIEYESKLNHFFPGNECLAICQYNKNRFSPEIIKDVINTHPLVIIGGFVCRNFYYIPPDEFLKIENTTLEVDRLLLNLIDREKTEEALRKSQKRFWSIYQQSPVAIELYDSKGSLIDANPKCLEMFGVSDIRKIIGFNLFEDPNITEELKRKIGLGEIVQFESEFDFDIVKKMGLYETVRSGRIYIDCTISPWEIAGAAQGYLVHVMDITERKLAEKALRKAEEDLRTIYNSITGYLTVVDRNYRIVNYNLTVERQFGKDLMGKVCYEAYQAKNEICPDCAVKKTFETGKPAFTFQPSTPVSKPVDIYTYPIFNEKGEIVAVIEHGIEVTERVKTKEALLHSEMELMESQRVAQVGSWHWIVATDTITWSPGYYRIIGRDLALPPPNYKEHLKMYTQKSAARLEAAVTESLKNGTPYELDLELLHPDGSRRSMIARGEAVRDANGNVAMLRGTLQDITQRKKVEDALRKSESLLEQTQEITRVGGWEYDATTQKITWTKEVYRIYEVDFNYNPSDVSKDIEFYAPGEQAKINKAFYRAVETGEPFDLELQFKGARGTRKWIRTTALTECISGKVMRVYGNIIDITERKNAEEALNRNRVILSVVFNNISDTLALMEVESNLSMRIVSVNKSYIEKVRLFREDITENDIIGQDRIIFLNKVFGFDHASIEAETRRFQQAVETRKLVNFEQTLEISGTKLYFEVTIVPVFDNEGICRYTLWSGHDITERKLAEEARRKSELSLSEAEKIAHLGNWEWDIQTNKLKWSDETYRILGYYPQEISPYYETFMNAIYPQDIEYVQKAVSDAMRNIKPYSIDHRIVRKDGTIITVHSQGKADFDLSGKPIRMMGTMLDITERKKAEEEIRTLNTELEKRVIQRTEQLDSANKELQAFSYSVSHDLRAPLRSIDGFTQALFEDYRDKLDETGKDYIKRVRIAVRTMSDLIEAMLSLSRLTSGEIKYETVDLSTISKKISDDLKAKEPGRQVDFIIQDGLKAKGDARMLNIVLDNLLNNAWKFTGKHLRAKIEIGKEKIEGKTVYFVRDDGAGFDMAYSDRLFAAFSRLHTEAEFPGIGIGLATIQRIIHRHGGKVWAKGAVEKGATFFFTLSGG